MNISSRALFPLFIIVLLAYKPSAQATAQSISAADEPTKETNPISPGSDSGDEGRQWRKGSPEGITENFYICIKENNYVTIEISNCASNEKDIQDSRLNSIYKALLASSNGEQKKALIDAQRAWLAWKNNEGLFEQSIYGSEQMDNATLEVKEMSRLARRADEMEHYRANIESRSR